MTPPPSSFKIGINPRGAGAGRVGGAGRRAVPWAAGASLVRPAPVGGLHHSQDGHPWRRAGEQRANQGGLFASAGDTDGAHCAG